MLIYVIHFQRCDPIPMLIGAYIFIMNFIFLFLFLSHLYIVTLQQFIGAQSDVSNIYFFNYYNNEYDDALSGVFVR